MSFVLFSSLVNVLQFVGILFAATLMAFLSQIIYKKFSDQKMLSEMNNRVKELRTEMKGLKDQDKLMSLNNEMLKISSDKMKLVMKPMMFSSVMFIVSFYIWSNLFKGFNLFIFSSPIPVIGTDIGWLLTYVFVSMIVSNVVRKKMGVQI